MKILISANTSWYVYNFRRALISAFIDDGYEIIVAAPPDDYSNRIVALGCRFLPLEMDNKGTSPLRDAALVWRLRQLLQAQRPDIVFTYTIKCNIYSCFAARPLDIPVVPNVSGLGTAFLADNWLNRMVRILYRYSFRWPKTIFFQNQDDKGTFSSLGLATDKQARLLPGSGVDLDLFAPAPAAESDTISFLLIARLLWDKGLGEFVAAARKIRQKYPQARFQILGFLNAENRSAIPRETLDGWIEEGVVEYLGATDDVRPHIAAADCVVLPSYYPEGTPRSLLEAAAMARPVITTDTPGCRNVVKNAQTGFLCEPRSVDSLTVAIEEFLALSREQQTEMGRQGRRKMELEYDETIVIDAYRKVINELVGDKSGTVLS
ncbi:MAG: glycosyltransferase family 4 protein [Marinosulfonomonas sp.]|nr:glycosyltransferase family 4 protein [Marinosulfonomonas sp.]